MKTVICRIRTNAHLAKVRRNMETIGYSFTGLPVEAKPVGRSGHRVWVFFTQHANLSCKQVELLAEVAKKLAALDKIERKSAIGT